MLSTLLVRSVMSEEPEPAIQMLQKIRLGSVKPFWITARDSLIVATITVLFTTLIYFFMYLVAGDLEIMKSVTFFETVAKSFVISLFLQYAYEYTGVNAMLCESASRYYTDQALSKYTARANALVDSYSAETAWNSILSIDAFKNDPNIQKIRTNQMKFHAMIRATHDAPIIAAYMQKQLPRELSTDDVYNKLIAPQRSEAKLSWNDVDMLMHLVEGAPYKENLNRLEAVPRLIEVLGLVKNKPLVEHFMNHGFAKLKSKKGRWVPTLDMDGLDLTTN